MATKKEEKAISIPALQIEEFSLHIVGESSLICHAWSHKAKLQMLQKSSKKASAGREAKRPIAEYAETLYWLTQKPDVYSMTDEEIMAAVDQGRFGFPSTAIKAAAVAGGYRSGVLDRMTVARAAFHIPGEFVEIIGKPIMREDSVTVGMGGADLRYRAEFLSWEMNVPIRLNVGAMSVEQVSNLLNVGGFACGIGDWRPEKDGSHGMFRIG